LELVHTRWGGRSKTERRSLFGADGRQDAWIFKPIWGQSFGLPGARRLRLQAGFSSVWLGDPDPRQTSGIARKLRLPATSPLIKMDQRIGSCNREMDLA